MKSGDRLIIYETGARTSAVGTATVVSVDVTDPRNPRGDIQAGKPLPEPISLAAIKASALFADSPLVRQARLSVVPLTDAQSQWLVRL